MSSTAARISFQELDVATIPTSRFALLANGAVTFRNLRAWRIPVPELT
jgi:hypothetical protein